MEDIKMFELLRFSLFVALTVYFIFGLYFFIKLIPAYKKTGESIFPKVLFVEYLFLFICVVFFHPFVIDKNIDLKKI